MNCLAKDPDARPRAELVAGGREILLRRCDAREWTWP